MKRLNHVGNGNGAVFKNVTIERAGDIDPDGSIRFVASNESEDRYGDIVRADGWDLKQYRSNPVVLFGHMHDSVVGAASRVWVDGKQLMADIKLAAQGTSALVDSVRALVQQKILKAVSVGFLPSEYKEIRQNGNFVGYEFTKQELLEISIVAVPANSEALAIARSLNLADEVRQRLFREPELGRVAAARARSTLEKLRVRG